MSSTNHSRGISGYRKAVIVKIVELLIKKTGRGNVEMLHNESRASLIDQARFLRSRITPTPSWASLYTEAVPQTTTRFTAPQPTSLGDYSDRLNA